jgi:hypothetical protein
VLNKTRNAIHPPAKARGFLAIGKIPHAGNAGMGKMLTSSGRTAWVWLHKLAERLERVRIVHGQWDRCLNHHYGGTDTAVFLDPPYKMYDMFYGSVPVAEEVEAWARENPDVRVCLCGHVDDYDLPGWETLQWSRGKHTYAGNKTTDKECLWFSPACLKKKPKRTLWTK